MSCVRGEPRSRLALGVISPAHLVFTVLAALAPLTLIVAVVPLHFLKGGAAVPGGFLLAGLVMVVFALALLQLRDSLPSAESLREVISAGLGAEVGAGAGMLALLAYNALQISVYGALGVYGSAAMALYGVSLSWWTIAWAALMLVTLMGLRGIQASSRLLVAILITEIGVLAWLGTALLPVAMEVDDMGGIFDVRQFGLDVAPMFTLVFGAFMGFEATLVFARETRGGRRGIRQATLISLGFIALFYASLTALIALAIGPDRIALLAAQGAEKLVLDLFWQYTPHWLTLIMQWFLAGSAFAALLALHNIAVRYFHALAQAGLLPQLLARTSADNGAPWVAGILQSALAAGALAAVVLAGIDPYLGLLLWGSALGLVVMVFLWALCAFACAHHSWRYRCGRWQFLVLQAVVCGMAFTGVVVLTVADFPALTGAGLMVNSLLLGSACVVFALGVWRAQRQRALIPDTVQALRGAL